MVVSTPIAKRMKQEENLILFRDIEKELGKLLASIQKFKLFGNLSADAFINGLEQYLNINFGTSEVVVKYFFHLIDDIFYGWYNETVADFDDINWKSLKDAFKLVVNTYSFELSSFIHLNRDEFLSKISKFETVDLEQQILAKPYETYFRIKTKYVKLIYNLDDKNCRLFALSSLNDKDKYVKWKEYADSEKMFYLQVNNEDDKYTQMRSLNAKRDQRKVEIELAKKLKSSLDSIKLLEEQLKNKQSVEEELNDLKKKLSSAQRGT